MYITNLLAFCLPIAIFITWGVLGYSALSLFGFRKNGLQALLIAPTIGISIILLPLFWLNLAGIPVDSIARPLTLILLFCCSLILYWKKANFSLSNYTPFLIILLLALLLTSRPALEFGFDWISYSNDDMENYCLGALRFLNYGFFETPNLKNLLVNRDYSLLYWFLHVVGMVRPGSELLLAWVSSLVHLSPLKIFMPLITAFYLTLISSTAALIYRSKSWYFPSLIAAILICFSSLTTLGVLYQLIAQVGGLSLFIGVSILLLKPVKKMPTRICFNRGILLAIAFSGFLVVYPELTPFLALSFILFFSINFLKGWRPDRSFFYYLGITAITTLIFLNTYIISVIHFLSIQGGGRLTPLNIQNAIFPYYLLPSGLANLWGLQPIAFLPPEPWLSLNIIIGAFLLTLTLISVVGFSWKKKYQHPTISICIIMLLMSVYLFVKNADFGLFKLAMFIQPFILGTLAIAMYKAFRPFFIKILLITLIIAFSIPTQMYYVEKSRAIKNGGFAEIPHASESKINLEFEKKLAAFPSSQIILLDTSNPSLAKLQALSLKGRRAEFLADNYFLNIYDFNNKMLAVYPSLNLLDIELRKKIQQNFSIEIFELLENKSKILNSFTQRKLTSNEIKDAAIVMSTPIQSIFNRSKFNSLDKNNFIIKPVKEVQNHLIFVSSQNGLHYYTRDPYLADPTKIAFSPLEGDYFYPKKSLASIGKYLLFQILNPTIFPRLELNITTSLNVDGSNKLPLATIMGKNLKSFPLIGRGSARVFSDPFEPQIINNIPYICIDMGKEGKVFPYFKKGLLNLYNKKVRLDRRHAVSFARNISLVSEKDYQGLMAPSSLSKFPEDLANPNLEYSGIYEDGWISEDAFFNLKQSREAKKLIINGLIPNISHSKSNSELTVYLDDKKIATRIIKDIKFNFEFPIKPSAGRKKVRLHFSKLQFLPNGDNRPVAAEINFIGFA